MDSSIEKNVSTTKDSNENILTTSKRKPNLIEADEGEEFVPKSSNDFPENNKNRGYSRYSSKGAVFAKRFIRTIRNLFEQLVFEKSNANWIAGTISVKKKYNDKTFFN